MAATDRMTRPPFERIKIIHGLLVNGRYPNCTSVAARLEVSPKSIQRDIEFMRDRLNLPVEFSRTHNGYYYTEEVTALPTVTMSDSEWQALIIARKALDQYRGCPWTPQMEEALGKISSGFDDLLGSSGVDALVSFRNKGLAPVAPEVFTAVSQALFSRRELLFRFQKFSTARPDLRRVHPYHLLCADGDWQLIGLNVDRGQIRVYALSRMYATKIGKATFPRPENFSVSNYLGTFFGLRAGDGTLEVELLFAPPAAWKVRQRLWHPTQSMEDQLDGSLLLNLGVHTTDELVSWILSWGDQVKVLQPQSLAQQVADVAAGIVARYSSTRHAK